MTSTALRASSVSVADAMSTRPVSVPPEASVWSAWTLMAMHGVRHLLVIASGRCVGVLDDRTIFAQWPLGPAALHRNTVDTVMRAAVSCVPASSDLRTAADVMLREGVDVVPVVDDDGVVVGIVTYTDILAAVARPDGEPGPVTPGAEPPAQDTTRDGAPRST